jgi:hypothetical protein
VDPARQALGKQIGPVAERFEKIRDRFESLEEVTEALKKAGVESSDLILAIDLTKSNEWSGKHSFHSMLSSQLQCPRLASTRPRKQLRPLLYIRALHVN